MRDKLAAIEASGAQLLAVDPHESYSARHLLGEAGLEAKDVGFPLLSDPACVVSATYGVAFQMRIHTEWSNRPATFIIDRQGVLRYARRGASFADRPKPDEILAELKKLQTVPNG